MDSHRKLLHERRISTLLLLVLGMGNMDRFLWQRVTSISSHHVILFSQQFLPIWAVFDLTIWKQCELSGLPWWRPCWWWASRLPPASIVVVFPLQIKVYPFTRFCSPSCLYYHMFLFVNFSFGFLSFQVFLYLRFLFRPFFFLSFLSFDPFRFLHFLVFKSFMFFSLSLTPTTIAEGITGPIRDVSESANTRIFVLPSLISFVRSWNCCLLHT
jgi:hypothetical protein